MRSPRPKWSDDRPPKQASLYHEFLQEERVSQQAKPNRISTALLQDTLRAVTPASIAENDTPIAATDTRKFEREFLPSQTPPSASPRREKRGKASPRSAGEALLARSSWRGSRDDGIVGGSYVGSRPRTRTMEENKNRDRSPGAVQVKSRPRLGSVHTSGSLSYETADYLASIGQPPQALEPARLSISTISSAAESSHGVIPNAHSRRILHLMKTLCGRMSGNVVFRRDSDSPWSFSYCYILQESGSLMYEAKTDTSEHKTLIRDLRGSEVKPTLDGEVPVLEISSPNRRSQHLHLKVQSQSDFDSWYAALLCWTPIEPKGMLNRVPKQQASAAVHPAVRSPMPGNGRRHSGLSVLKEAPIIKVGKMIFWDTNPTLAYSNSGATGPGRPQPQRMQSYGSRRWRRISCTLRENGELKLYSDADVTLVSVVQLSQLSRCAVQRLDPSFLDNDFCIAIYPKYSSTSNSLAPLRPVFLSLDNRILFEVWFVLLRAFTIPQLYGPKLPALNEDLGSSQKLETLLATSTSDMFRMERSLSVRVVEAKMYPPTAAPQLEQGFVHVKSWPANSIADRHDGYYVEVLLDGETRAKTVVKYNTELNPLWGEPFDFLDLPAVLSSASVLVKRRPPEHTKQREQHESRLVHEAYGFAGDQNGGYSGITFDQTCGKVEIYLDELEASREIEKWWPIMNMSGQQVGEILIKARAEEGVILMARDYQPLSDLLHRFSNGLTLQIANKLPNDLKRLSDCLLNIFQVSGQAGEWLMALVEEEIDGTHKETSTNRLNFSRRVGSNDSGDTLGLPSERELIVRDLNKNATLEANLLFRGNTLLTKSVDSHMKRVGKEYLEETLGAKIREINEKDPECEVDPNRVSKAVDLERNWRRLLLFTQEVWTAVLASKDKCPVELRVIFRHIRACAEDRYGDFLRSVSYSSVSGFLFLRFFCPAVLNPKLFGLLKDDVKPHARRSFTLIAKSLQTLANTASFGLKEHWMEPMNAFLTSHRESFKNFINDVCSVPSPPSSSAAALPLQASALSIEKHLSYSTPMAIMQRLPPTSREGFPSLPYLIDHARAFADLVQLWLEATTAASSTTSSSRRTTNITAQIQASRGDLLAFHKTCTSLHARTQECLNRAERAERPNSALSFRWEEVIEQLQHQDSANGDDTHAKNSFDVVAEQGRFDIPKLAGNTRTNLDVRTSDVPAFAAHYDAFFRPQAATGMHGHVPSDDTATEADEDGTMPLYDITPALDPSTHAATSSSRRAAHTPSLPPEPDASASSAPSSDTEHSAGTTALPSYNREIRQRERREAARQQRWRAERESQPQREKGKLKAVLPGLSKKRRERRRHGAGAEPGAGYTSHG